MASPSPFSIVERLRRHARITLRARAQAPPPSFLILFINSICNLTCEHCFYWRNLNRRDDLTLEELTRLSHDLATLGRVANLNLSGGEPFLRPDFADVCRLFVRNNGVNQVYVPTNGYFPDRTVAALRDVLREPSLRLFTVELSLDGTEEFHNQFRGSEQSFQLALETYDSLAKLQHEDPRLRIHAVSTATADNMDEIGKLSRFLVERCPQMEHHNLAIIRGDRKNPSLEGPRLRRYQELAAEVAGLWGSRQAGRYGSSVEPLLQWAKVETARQKRQVVPCTAGVLSAVVYSNGDVSVCENHEPLGNIRDHSFSDLWHSSAATLRRESIRRCECHCTNEVFLWPSIVYQPLQLGRALFRTRIRPDRALDPEALLTSATPQAGPLPARSVDERLG